MMKLWKFGLFGAALMAISCGEPTDRPEDCNPNEFFDEARSVCRSCPAVRAPVCSDGCGFKVVPDEVGCPAAECRVERVETEDETEAEAEERACNDCSAGEFFSPEKLACQPCSGATTCASGEEPVAWVSGDQCVLQCPSEPAPE